MQKGPVTVSYDKVIVAPSNLKVSKPENNERVSI